MRGRLLLITFSCLILVAASAWGAVDTVSAGSPWHTRTAFVRLAGLPRRYSCQELERKVRDVLDFVGARGVAIHATRCEAALSAARSPEVRVRFSYPRSQPAAVASRVQTISIQPGQPASIDESDCVLMRRLRTLLPGTVTDYRLDCHAPERLRAVSFYVHVRKPYVVTEARAAVPSVPR